MATKEPPSFVRNGGWIFSVRAEAIELALLKTEWEVEAEADGMSLKLSVLIFPHGSTVLSFAVGANDPARMRTWFCRKTMELSYYFGANFVGWRLEKEWFQMMADQAPVRMTLHVKKKN